MSKCIISLFLLWAPVLSAAEVELTEKSLLKTYPAEPLLNEIIAFEAVAEHKFNDKAKNSCGNGKLLKANEDVVECQMYAPGTSRLELYICDDKKTFCRREEIAIKTQQPKGLKQWIQYYRDTWSSPSAWKTPYRTGVSQMPVARGFTQPESIESIVNKTKTQTKKNVLLYFTQAACEPCRIFKELSLSSDEFQNGSTEFVRLQMDLDVETSPEKIKPLNIKGTPTLVVLNKNFEELDRRMGVMSPTVLKEWLASFDKKTKSIENLKKLSEAKRTDEETLRLSRWSFYTEAGVSKALSYARTFKSPTADMVVWKQMLETNESSNREVLLAGLKKLEPSLSQASDSTLSFYKDALLTVAFAPGENNKTVLSQVAALAENHVKRMNARDDKLEAALQNMNLLAGLKYAYEKEKMTKEAHRFGVKLAALIDAAPRAPGVTETPFLAFLKADALKDKSSRDKLANQLREENKNDYTVDYFLAQEAYANKEYDKALTLAEQSLAIAKDRSWQKAFLLKLDILEAQNKQDEGLKLVQGLLAEMKLPAMSTMKVHSFVQTLRKKEVAFQKGA